ncbi:hypothetical protein ERJ75_001056500 [Trypanosoma vivax]|uniref:Uncharacterized protein n=1 Tax=Trypanosoma vivax (strain Y486) TaxID=1055687 RepID=G0U0G0_TRYVY|nr:hypothetical protein TRVL_04117 [Trypanosoma vivax]KAH8610791.1 hypothetical protein ERJ75_001056500 [Trypanosoma vivax]CCC49558.1 conserved hypothetical protein [Trypanosoma vivax Y486]
MQRWCASAAGSGITIKGTGTSIWVGWRAFARGRPYTPLGTVQDFTSSPHHMNLAEKQRELDAMCGRPPTHLYEGPTITTARGARALFEPDMREDTFRDDVPEHLAAARQRMAVLQSDSYGESIRGVVAPPPPPDLHAPLAFRQPRVELGAMWWTAMTVIVIAFLLMLRFGE